MFNLLCPNTILAHLSNTMIYLNKNSIVINSTNPVINRNYSKILKYKDVDGFEKNLNHGQDHRTGSLSLRHAFLLSFLDSQEKMWQSNFTCKCFLKFIQVILLK